MLFWWSYIGLFLESLPLNDGIVQLGVRVHQFLVRDEELKTFRQARYAAVVLRQGAHDFRMVAEEGRIEAVNLDEITNQLFLKKNTKRSRIISNYNQERSLGKKEK